MSSPRRRGSILTLARKRNMDSRLRGNDTAGCCSNREGTSPTECRLVPGQNKGWPIAYLQSTVSSPRRRGSKFDAGAKRDMDSRLRGMTPGCCGFPSPLEGEGARRACPGLDPGADEGLMPHPRPLRQPLIRLLRSRLLLKGRRRPVDRSYVATIALYAGAPSRSRWGGGDSCGRRWSPCCPAPERS